MAIRRFSGGTSAPQCARRAVREELRGALTQPKLAEVELIVSELAANSVRHSGCGDADELSLEANVEADRVRVRLFDPGKGFDVHTPRPPSSGSASGYGLVLLDRLSDRWGVQRNGR